MIYFLYLIYFIYHQQTNLEAIPIQLCPFLEYSFQILGKKWNGLILHYISLREDNKASFSEMVREIPHITPRVLSMRLTELAEYGLIRKIVTDSPTVTVTYELTEKGISLVKALQPIQQWAFEHSNSRSEE